MNITGEIKCYLGDKEYAFLRYSESRDSFSIDIVSVPASHRNQGIGTMLIEHILKMADGMNKDIYISARPFGSGNAGKIERLEEFYGRFGFKVYDRGLTVAHMVKKWSAQPDALAGAAKQPHQSAG